jgi:predicted lipoprotein with Yx(FWY)xxD motif
VAARKFIVTPVGCAAAATALTALTALTGCAPKGGDGAYDAAQQQVPALATAGADQSSAPPATTAPPRKLTESIKAVTIPKMGKVVVDQKGWVLYRFDKDTANPPKSACDGKCAQVWPPALTDGNPELKGIDPAVVGTVIRADGSRQITLAGWPIYRYIGDPKPGAWKGQNVAGTWFVVAPDGKKNLTCLPTPPPAAVAPPAASDAASPEATTADGSGSGSGY